MKSKRKETPNPTSELIIYTMNLEKEQKNIYFIYMIWVMNVLKLF